MSPAGQSGGRSRCPGRTGQAGGQWRGRPAAGRTGHRAWGGNSETVFKQSPVTEKNKSLNTTKRAETSHEG